MFWMRWAKDRQEVDKWTNVWVLFHECPFSSGYGSLSDHEKYSILIEIVKVHRTTEHETGKDQRIKKEKSKIRIK